MAKIFRKLLCSKHGKSCHDECLWFTSGVWWWVSLPPWVGESAKCMVGKLGFGGSKSDSLPIFVVLMSQECFLVWQSLSDLWERLKAQIHNVEILKLLLNALIIV